jgi:hypothetical protein
MTFAELDGQGAPKAIGVVFSKAALDELPVEPVNRRCAERKPGIAPAKCQHTHEHVLPLPDVVARRRDIPFKWVLLNWQPVGHIPPGIYSVPHFDIHYMMAPIDEIFAIEPGECGPEFVRCDQFATGRKPLPKNYMHPDFTDVEAVVPAMGNHLVDLTGAEVNKQPFTLSWIYGIYDGKVIFYEQMVAREYLLSKPDGCTPIKSPKAVAVAGFYPRSSCVRLNPVSGEYVASMEDFTYRTASAPE